LKRTLYGLRRNWFQGRASYLHYDVTTEVREQALHAGALASRKREVLIAARNLKAEMAASVAAPRPADVATQSPSQTLSLF